MDRTKKLKMNTSMSLLNRIFRVLSGLILPRLILANYGSETNGLVSSISYFLSIITFLDMGVGVVVRSALYRPLSLNNTKQVSLILSAAKKYFRNIAYILIIYLIVIIMFYPLIIESSLGQSSTILLILAMSISYFGQYYFGIVNELLLSANQQDYIQLGSESVVVILNLMISMILIEMGASIEWVKLGSGLVFLIRPVFLSWYVKKQFNIDYEVQVKEDPLPQKWNGMGQHIAYSINNTTDVAVLTIFSTLENISVYSVYNLIVSAINMILSSITTGLQSFFGNLYVSDEIEALNSYFDKIEWLVHTAVVFFYGLTGVLINSFVLIYTSGVRDISYAAPVFAFFLVLSNAVYSLRIPYNSMILSAGHFRETEKSSYIEAILNIVIAVILVYRFGLAGVAFGRFIAITYRTLYLARYLSKNIIFRKWESFIKHIIIDLLSIGIIFIVSYLIFGILQVNNIFDWIIIAVIISFISLIFLFFINYIFFKNMTVNLIDKIRKK